MLPLTRQVPSARGNSREDFIRFLIRRRSAVIVTVFGAIFFLYFWFMIGALDGTRPPQKQSPQATTSPIKHYIPEEPENEDQVGGFFKDLPEEQEPVPSKEPDTTLEPEEKPNDLEDIVEDIVPTEPQDHQSSSEIERRRNAVKDAFVHAWAGYETYAMGADDYKPVSKKPKNWVSGGIGLTVIDALDTMLIMDLKDTYSRARKWVEEKLDFNRNHGISVFETNIRALGGLLSAYDLTHDDLYLDKARDVADRLMPAFETPSGIPLQTVNLQTGKATVQGWLQGYTVLAEFGTMQLEFRHLSRLLGDPKYEQAAMKVIEVMKEHMPQDGLFPIYFHPEQLRFKGAVSFGAMGDSFYEYLLKQWIQGGKKEHWLREMYDKTVEGLLTHLVVKSDAGLTYVAERHGASLKHKMDHLACFTAGMLALGATGENRDEQMQVAEELAYTCYQMYRFTSTKLSPEYVEFDQSRGMHLGPHRFYILRPETVESFFVLWRLTKDPKYREWGWDVFQAIEQHCKVPDGGYSGISDVNIVPPKKDDYQQSFFLAETLKYLYLLFSEDDVIPLDEYVFNTEAHPLRIWEDNYAE